MSSDKKSDERTGSFNPMEWDGELVLDRLHARFILKVISGLLTGFLLLVLLSSAFVKHNTVTRTSDTSLMPLPKDIPPLNAENFKLRYDCPEEPYVNKTLEPWSHVGISSDLIAESVKQCPHCLRIQVIDNKFYVLNHYKLIAKLPKRAKHIKQLERLLLGISKVVEIPDLDILFNILEVPVIHRSDAYNATQPPPVVASYMSSKKLYYDIHVPNYATELSDELLLDSIVASKYIKVEDKKDEAHWQGRLLTQCSSGWSNHTAVKINALHEKESPVNIRFLHDDYCDQDIVAAIRGRGITTVDPLSFKQQLEFKFILFIGVDRLESQLIRFLASNSVVMKDPLGFEEWFEHKLVNGKHWIVPDDFASSVVFNLDRALTDPQSLLSMVKASTEFAVTELNGDVIRCYWHQVLSEYSNLLKFKVEKDSNAVTLEKALEKPIKF